MGYRVAVVGATGAVGREMLQTLAERNFPADKVYALASSRSAGSRSVGRWAGGGRLAETPFLCFLGLFLTIFDCFLVLFDCFLGAQASILLIVLFRASFFDCFW